MPIFCEISAACSAASPCWPPPYDADPSYQITRMFAAGIPSSVESVVGMPLIDCPCAYTIALDPRTSATAACGPIGTKLL